MSTRSSTSMMTFQNAFVLPNFPDVLPPGTYEVVVEEELLQGLSFEAWRRTATYLVVRGAKGFAGRTTRRTTTDIDLQRALSQDRALLQDDNESEAAHSPQEDFT